MNGKIIKNDKIKMLIGAIVYIILLMGLLLLYWKAELRDCDRPIAHRTEALTNEFELTLGEIRGIYVKSREEYKKVQLHISIEDEDKNIIWENDYDDIDITNSFKEIEHFYPENLIHVPKGKYVASYYVNGNKNTQVRGQFVEYRGSYRKFYIGFSILLLIVMTISYLVILQNKLKLYKKYLILAVVTGILYGVCFPSLSMPDESSHFLEAYRISNQILGKQVLDDEGYVLLRADDYDSVTYLQNMSTISEWYESTVNGSLDEYVPADYNSSVSIRERYAYWVPALGITIARWLHLSGRALISMGRMFNLIFTAGIIALGIKITPCYKRFFTLIGLLPETVLLMNSYSYDALNMAMSIITITFFLYLSQKENINFRELVFFVGIITVFISIKIVYFPIALLVFLLPRNKLQIDKKSLGLTVIIILGACIIWGSVNIPNMIELAFQNDGAISDEPKLINMGYLICNFSQVAFIFARTLFENTYSYIQSMLGTIYGVGRFGNLLGYSMPAWLVILIYTILGITLLGEDNSITELNKKKATVYSVSIVIASSCAILFSMLFACTMTNYKKIEGVQGRYFLPILCIIPLISYNKPLEISEKTYQKCLHIMQWINIAFAWAVLHWFVTEYFVV